MTSRSTTTTDHDDIRRWIEERGGRPARVKGTGGEGDGGLIRINFDEPGGDDDDDRLEDISWEVFFQAFDDNGLAFVHQDETAKGGQSRFSRFVKREAKD